MALIARTGKTRACRAAEALTWPSINGIWSTYRKARASITYSDYHDVFDSNGVACT